MVAALSKVIGEGAINGWFLGTQLATIPFDWWMSRRIKLTVHVPPNFSAPRGTLVIANHKSFLDPFLITYHLGRQNWYTTVPTRFPTKTSYARRPLLGSVIKLLGAYSIGSTSMDRAKKLLFTRDLLDRGHSVLLFPEGKIVEEGGVVAEFQRGANMLFAHDYPTVFVRLSGFNTNSFLHPSTVEDARMDFSAVMYGDAATKLERLRDFFDGGGL
uniref:1-acyl-sn-glycerol-3-phosphate acyltransferase n=1 Tax=uncultured bacterium CSLC2 TaxID=1091571 RepID=Q8KP00_9BACT|nr:1-acyl-sn-glycerol-3-phosphate acyltransferase [uncultured bacterium CSLC2]